MRLPGQKPYRLLLVMSQSIEREVTGLKNRAGDGYAGENALDFMDAGGIDPPCMRMLIPAGSKFLYPANYLRIILKGDYQVFSVSLYAYHL
jgi:hypothetical protein